MRSVPLPSRDRRPATRPSHGDSTLAPRAAVVALLAAMTAAPIGAQEGQRAPTSVERACTLRAETPQRVILPDGAAVSIDATDMAINDGEVLVAGTPTHVWPKENARPATHPSAIGVLRDARGRFHLVPSPYPTTRVWYPRVASAGARGWHLLFVTGTEGAPGDAVAFRQAEIWYGRYDGRRWHDVQLVARARSALLDGVVSSWLRYDGDSLAFAYPFDRAMEMRSNASSNQGIVLLRRRSGGWRADTLPTWRGPRAVELAADGGGRLTAFIAQEGFEEGRVRPLSLYQARFDGRWRAPRLLERADPLTVHSPIVATNGARRVLTWRQSTGDPSIVDYRIGVIDGGDSLTHLGSIAARNAIDTPALVRIASDRALLLARDGQARDRMRALLVRGRATQDLGVVELPLQNFTLVAAATSDDRVLVATGALGARPEDPLASTLLTAIAVRCPAAAASVRR